MEIIMNNKEKIIQLLDDIPDYQMRYVLTYVPGITADEKATNTFYERMVENYKNNPNPENDRGHTLKKCVEEWGDSVEH